MLDNIFIYFSVGIILCLLWRVKLIRDIIKSFVLKAYEYLEGFLSKTGKEPIRDTNVNVVPNLEELQEQIDKLSILFNEKKPIPDYSNDRKQISVLSESISEINVRLKEMESQLYHIKEMQNLQIASSSNLISTEQIPMQKSQISFSKRIMYAMLVRTEIPYGFEMSTLSDVDSGHFFEIEQITETEALYHLKKDEKVYKYALLSFNKSLNENICDFENKQLSEEQTIEITKDGRLSLENDVWRIVEKMKVKFVNK
ncbi:hypothetical protein NE451_03120 [Bacteroides nordii]|jgi:hypothetical protein|uniref:hypothetical protein n=1 Tax=Bacteroides nordii TaxID=291645 RepID=UPI00210C4633|nr:hypothetical protein [Bacteroides nordii]MCQ4913481.1 hypothetical protein [Bacteroides nordii]